MKRVIQRNSNGTVSTVRPLLKNVRYWNAFVTEISQKYNWFPSLFPQLKKNGKLIRLHERKYFVTSTNLCNQGWFAARRPGTVDLEGTQANGDDVSMKPIAEQ